MKEFLAKAKRLGLCKEYTAKVNNAGSKKQLVDVAMDANGLSWICSSIARGWGLSPEYISQNYAPFLNGRYVFDGNGYSSTIYCQNNHVNVNTTAAAIIDCQGTINVKRVCELHIANSRVTITGNARCVVYLYNSTIDNSDSFKGVIIENNTYE